MDPTESILSMLDYSSDPMFQDAETLDLGLGDIMSCDFNFSPTDIFSDDLLSSIDFTDSNDDSDLSYTLVNPKRNSTALNKTKITLNQKKSASQQTNHKSQFSILNNNSTVKRNNRMAISMNAPKVYISRPTKKTSAAGTSILLKSKKSNNNTKRRSLLMQNKEPKRDDVFSENNSDALIQNAFWHHDHDYCRHIKDDAYTKKECPSFSTTNSVTEAQNELEDILQGYIPDDVMLNELPNCLQDLINIDSNFMLNSEDLLHGLNDDQYFDDLEQKLLDCGPDLNLPNLTEDDLNMITQSNVEKSINDDAECVVNDIGVDIVYSSFAESRSDSFDCVSSTTRCTEESSSEDTDYRSRKAKRHRSLSGTSLTSRRKRRFSSRSSLNSSDSMSDSSSCPDDSAPSSRSSSPERPFYHYASISPFLL